MSKKLPSNTKLEFYVTVDSKRADSCDVVGSDAAKKAVSRVFRDVRRGSYKKATVVHRLKAAG